MQTLTPLFRVAPSMREVKDERRKHAIAAHIEIRGLLEADLILRSWGVATGSYPRRTGTWPAKTSTFSPS
jgi:hypothetical protein